MSGRPRARLPWLLWAVTMLLLVPTLTLTLLNESLQEDPWFIPIIIVMILGYSTVGALLASRNPTNPIGWTMMAFGAGWVLVGLTDEFLVYTRVTNPGALAGEPIAAWVANWLWLAILTALPLLVLLFPTGRAAGPRWRFLPPALLVISGVGILASILNPGPVDTSVAVDNPTGIPALKSVTELIGGVVWLGGVVPIAALSIVSLVLRYRRSAGEERQQIRWLAYIAATVGTVILLGIATGLVMGDSFENSFAADAFFIPVFVLIGIGVPAAMGVAILKYRLYDLDLVIKKTIVFAIVVAVLTSAGVVATAVLGGIFVDVFSFENPSLLFLVGAGFGLLLIPLYRRSTRIADRVVYGGRAKPYEVLTEFSERMADSYSTEDVLPRMAQILASGTGADAARVWLRVGGQLRPVATWPPDGSPTPIPMQGDELPPLPGRESAFEVRHQGELLGAASVTMPASDPMNPSKEKLARDLASQAGLVLRNVRLIEELRESRRRIVAAQDERARKLERDIHDGAQQQLVALAVKQRLVASFVGRDDQRAKDMLAELQAETSDALEDLRSLAGGIYPPLLADRGLAAALESQARRSPVPVSVEPDGVGRYSQEIESAVYFCTLEALQNVTKYAEASRVTVTLVPSDGDLTFEIADDGRGFDPSEASQGTGLQGMADRLDAIGGELTVQSAPGSGTTIRGRVPAAAMENGP